MSLNFDYNRSIRYINEIEDIAREIKTHVNSEMESTIGSIKASWDGDSANIFVKHCSETKQQITARAAKLDDLAKKMREIANIIREAEEHVKREID